MVTVSSVLASRAVTLASCYLADLAGPTGVSHLRLVPGLPPRVSQRVLDGLPGQSHARACLLDDAAQLRDAVGELLAGEEVGVELGEENARAGGPGVDGRARLARRPASGRRR